MVIISISINYQVDPMDDRANLSYAALPERLYIVQDGQVVYQVALRLEIFHQLKIVSFFRGDLGHLTTKYPKLRLF